MSTTENAPPGAGFSGLELPNASAEPAGSILADIRRTREIKASAAPPTLTLSIAGYGEPSRLAVVYRYPAAGYERVVEAVDHERLSPEKNARINGNADLLVACCASIVGRRPDRTLVNLDTDEPVSEAEVVKPEYPGHRFNVALAEKLGITVGEDATHKARFICREVFSPGAQATGRYEGDLSLIAHGNIVFQWLQGVEADRDEEQAGE